MVLTSDIGNLKQRNIVLLGQVFIEIPAGTSVLWDDELLMSKYGLHSKGGGYKVKGTVSGSCLY